MTVGICSCCGGGGSGRDRGRVGVVTETQSCVLFLGAYWDDVEKKVASSELLVIDS